MALVVVIRRKRLSLQKEGKNFLCRKLKQVRHKTYIHWIPQVEDWKLTEGDLFTRSFLKNPRDLGDPPEGKKTPSLTS
jgi:hypothetical protein